MNQCTVTAERIERPGCGECFQATPIERFCCKPPRKVGQILEAALGPALFDDGLDGTTADVLQRRQRVADGAGFRPGLRQARQ